MQAIFDSSQDGLVSLEAPWYLPSFCDILDGEDIVATKGVGPLKGCGVVFSDLFFWGVETTKSRYTLEKNIEMQTWKLKMDPWKTFHQEIMLMISWFNVEFHGV